MKYMAVKGQVEYPVTVIHWWPGRDYAGEHPLNPQTVEEYEKRGTRFVTLAVCLNHNARAECCPRDAPSRKLGREIALGRLEKDIEEIGWRLECRT